MHWLKLHLYDCQANTQRIIKSKTVNYPYRARLRPKVWLWRHGPESNRHSRICSPLHRHSATAPNPKAGKEGDIRFLSCLGQACIELTIKI